jgi:hypothetical protein
MYVPGEYWLKLCIFEPAKRNNSIRYKNVDDALTHFFHAALPPEKLKISLSIAQMEQNQTQYYQSCWTVGSSRCPNEIGKW